MEDIFLELFLGGSMWNRYPFFNVLELYTEL